MQADREGIVIDERYKAVAEDVVKGRIWEAGPLIWLRVHILIGFYLSIVFAALAVMAGLSLEMLGAQRWISIIVAFGLLIVSASGIRHARAYRRLESLITLGEGIPRDIKDKFDIARHTDMKRRLAARGIEYV
jgi:hypothetical protein